MNTLQFQNSSIEIKNNSQHGIKKTVVLNFSGLQTQTNREFLIEYIWFCSISMKKFHSFTKLGNKFVFLGSQRSFIPN